jgi:hypothetical protein
VIDLISYYQSPAHAFQQRAAVFIFSVKDHTAIFYPGWLLPTASR